MTKPGIRPEEEYDPDLDDADDDTTGYEDGEDEEDS